MRTPDLPELPNHKNDTNDNKNENASVNSTQSDAPIFLAIVTGFSSLIALAMWISTFSGKGWGYFLSALFFTCLSIGCGYLTYRLYLMIKERQREIEDREYELRRAQLSGSFVIDEVKDTVSSDEVISPYFTDYQKNLKKQRQNLVNKYDGVTRLIDSLFGRGTLTSERYSTSIKKAYKTGINAAKKGADLCDALKGEDLPNDSSRNVLDHYMDLTKQMADLIENQIVVLAGLDLDRSEKIQTSLNEQISEINSTIHMYE